MKQTTKRLPAALAALAGVALAASLAAEPIESWPVLDTTWTPDGEVRMITGDAVPTDPLPFIGITPCRLIDTRSSLLPAGYGTPALSEGGARTFIMVGQSHCFVPPGAQAVSINVTAANPTDIGNIRVYPADAGVPNVSTVNFRPGQNTANSTIVVLASNGAMTALVSFADADLVVDVNGYFGGSLQTLKWKGAWSGSISYGIDDVVSQNGSSYVSRISQNLGNTPSAGLPAWDLVAQKGATGSQGPAGPAGTSPWSLNGSFLHYSGGSVGIGTAGAVNAGVKLDVQGGDIEIDSGRGILAEGGARILSGPNGHGFRFRTGHPQAQLASFENSQGVEKVIFTSSGAIQFSGQKACNVSGSGWRDTVLVPLSWTAASCDNLRFQYAASNYQLICIFEGVAAVGASGGGIPNPNCGW